MPHRGRSALLESPDGESRAEIARVGDAFPLDPSTAIFDASTETCSGSAARPWGLRYAATPKVRAEVADTVDCWVYDPVSQTGIDRITGAPLLGKRGSGIKETTGDPDSSRPSTEETTTD